MVNTIWTNNSQRKYQHCDHCTLNFLEPRTIPNGTTTNPLIEFDLWWQIIDFATVDAIYNWTQTVFLHAHKHMHTARTAIIFIVLIIAWYRGK